MKYADKIIVDGEPLIVTSNGVPDSFKTAMISLAADLKSLLNELEYTTSNNHAELATQDADSVIASLSGSNPTTYVITAITVNCGLENPVTSVIQNTSYTTTIAPEEGYAVSNVTVVMGGYNITSDVYDSSTNTIKIINVTGIVEIRATAVELYTITKNLANSEINNIATTVLDGSSYTAEITPATGYDLYAVSITMGGTDITSTVVTAIPNGFRITISEVTGDIVISTLTYPKSYAVINDLTNCTTSNNAAAAEYGSTYFATLTASTGYTRGTTLVTMGGTDVTADVYVNGSIYINRVTGDIVIKSTSNIKTYNIHKPTSADHVIFSNDATTITHGSEYYTEVYATDHYDLVSITVRMPPDTDITSTAVSNNTITISNVTGNINISTGVSGELLEITNTLTHCTTDNDTSYMSYGGHYTATITPESGYTLGTVTVTMGGDDVTSTVYSNGVIDIPSLTGALVITATASA